jgi:biopolymer transport protein ExbD
MILLVFLLKHYSATVSNLTPSNHTRLPVAAADGQPKDGLKLEIAESAILIDQKPIVRLNHFEFAPGEAPEHGTSGALYKVLSAQRRKAQPNHDSSLLVFADERTPYATLQRVLASAAGSGFVDLELVVIQTQ